MKVKYLVEISWRIFLIILANYTIICNCNMKPRTKPDCPFVRIFSQKKTNRNLLNFYKCLTLMTFLDNDANIICYLSLMCNLVLNTVFLFISCLEHEPKTKLGLQLPCAKWAKVVKSNPSCTRNSYKMKLSIKYIDEPFEKWGQRKCIIG